MHKTLAAIALSMLVLPAATLYGAIYELEGQVTAGASLFPPVVKDLSIPFNDFGFPAGGFPVDFEARLEIGTEPTDWSFEFVLTDDERSVEYGISGSSHLFPRPEGIINDVVLLPRRVAIELQDRSTAFWESFSLNLDLENNTGQWDWGSICLACDLVYPLPAATATVTSIRVVPEPSSMMIGVMAGVWSLVALRRYRL